MFWVDEIVADIIQKYPKKDSFLINDSMTPSGHAHIGSLRGLIIHDLIRRGLTEKGQKAVFQYGFDDFDPMDGLPIYVDKSFEKYMGMPLNKVPSPDGQSKSFADQYIDEFTTVFNGLGIKPEIYLGSDLYKSGRLNEAIKKVLDNAAEIRKIYKEISGSNKGEGWYPFQVVCPQCGKIGTTIVTDWDGKEVTYECRESLVEWAKGCGNKGKISPFSGNGKLPYKAEWPAKWAMMNVDIEGEGKDHAAAGGTRNIADEIYRKIFQKKPPYDIPYEYILVAGKKMSKSKGSGTTAKDIYDFLPANILRFLFVRTRAKRAIDFTPEGETIPLLYDEYDRMAQLSRQEPEADLARSFYYTETDSAKEFPLYLLRFSKIAYLLQMPKINIFDYAESEKGSKLSTIEKEEIQNRLKVAKQWLETFAPENYKFQIKDSLPEPAKKINAKQKEFLAKISAIIKLRPSWAGEDLHQEIHRAKNEMQIAPREAFAAIYLSFLGKDSGPQAGWLLASLDREFVIKRLQEVI